MSGWFGKGAPASRAALMLSNNVVNEFVYTLGFRSRSDQLVPTSAPPASGIGSTHFTVPSEEDWPSATSVCWHLTGEPRSFLLKQHFDFVRLFSCRPVIDQLLSPNQRCVLPD